MPSPFGSVGVREADIGDPATATRIDDFVRRTSGATPFHLTGWSRAVERGCRQRARYLVAERGDGAIVGVLPLTEMRSRLFGKALVSAGFAVDGGILGDGVEALAAAVWDMGQRIDCPVVELRGGPVPAGWTTDATTYVGFARDLADSDEAELKAIPKRQRAEIRKSIGFGVDTRPGDDTASDLATHYAIYAESVRNLGSPVFPKALFAAVLDELDADILIARHDGRALSSVLSLYFNGTVYPYWGGGTRRAREYRTNDHLYFTLMRHAKARGCTRFDFGRSKVGTGAAAYKKTWGFAPTPLIYAKKSDGPAREINPQNPKFAAMVAMWQRLPLPVATMIGPWIARGLG